MPFILGGSGQGTGTRRPKAESCRSRAGESMLGVPQPPERPVLPIDHSASATWTLRRTLSGWTTLLNRHPDRLGEANFVPTDQTHQALYSNSEFGF